MTDKYKKIKALAFDVDGVLTDGKMLATDSGDLLRCFDAKDSFAMRMAAMHGMPLAFITGGCSESILKRGRYVGILPEDIYLHSRDKLKDFHDFCSRHGLTPEEVMYFGDDMPDIPVLKACGVGAAPADGALEAREAADYVSPFGGGHGFVRHTIEMVLKIQGAWQLDVEKYGSMF